MIRIIGLINFMMIHIFVSENRSTVYMYTFSRCPMGHIVIIFRFSTCDKGIICFPLNTYAKIFAMQCKIVVKLRICIISNIGLLKKIFVSYCLYFQAARSYRHPHKLIFFVLSCCQAVIMHSSGSCQEVVRQSSSSRQVVVRQSSGSRKAVVR